MIHLNHVADRINYSFYNSNDLNQMRKVTPAKAPSDASGTGYGVRDAKWWLDISNRTIYAAIKSKVVIFFSTRSVDDWWSLSSNNLFLYHNIEKLMSGLWFVVRCHCHCLPIHHTLHGRFFSLFTFQSIIYGER